MPLRPTTQQQHRTIRLSGSLHLLAFDQPPRLETRPQLFDGKRRVFPRHHVALGCAAGRPPARLLHRLLPRDPVALAIAQEHDLRPLRDQRAPQFNQGDVEVLGTMPLGALAYAPGER